MTEGIKVVAQRLSREAIEEACAVKELVAGKTYPITVTRCEPSISKRGQQMLVLQFAPCAVEGDPSTADYDNSVRYWLNLPYLQDRDAWRNRLAEKLDVDPDEIEDDEIDRTWKTAEQQAVRYMMRDLHAILGSDLVSTSNPKNPEFGDALDKVESYIAEIIEGTRSLQKYCLYGKTKAEEFNGEVQVKFAYLYETLPRGTTLAKL